MANEYEVDVTLQLVRQAIANQDPQCVELFLRLVKGEKLKPREPVREGAYTFESFLQEIHSPGFRVRKPDEQAQLRMQKLATLESPDAEIALPDELRSHELLVDLWQAKDNFRRNCLILLIHECPLVYGPFKAFKRIFKESEASGDTEVLGVLAARFDSAWQSGAHSVSERTLAYLCRRAWRFLRRVGETMPSIYADVATDFLVGYEDGALNRSWIFNHIFFHETRSYGARKFEFEGRRPTSMLKHRAFVDAWKRSPRPLFSLLEGARSEKVRSYASLALKTDFRSSLREVEPEWVSRLIGKGSDSLDSFAVWILNNVSRFEQDKFVELNLHEPVLRLLSSGSEAACKYAAEYTRTHARDLPVNQLILLANSKNREVRKLALGFLSERDARKDVGLEAWGRLLDTEHGNKIAEETLRKKFSAKELTEDWFADRILVGQGRSFQFAIQRLTNVHPLKTLGSKFFCSIAQKLDAATPVRDARACSQFLSEKLEALDPTTIEQEDLQRLLLHPFLSSHLRGWVGQGKLPAPTLGVEFLKTIAFHPAWEQDEWIAKQRETIWGRNLNHFDESLSELVLGWLSDVRDFSPTDLGFPWLLELVARRENRYHQFASERLTKAFLPADFAPQGDESQPGEAEASSDGEINVDLEGASFVFTGKLMTMQRSEAQGKVTKAGGANSNSVTKKLHYLVIGDEGSPLYGQGRKGSKQLKAEKFNEEGAGIKVISETAFLQMLAGEKREFSEDTVQAGCEHLWSLATESEHHDDPLSRFARKYIRHHHPEICLAETDRPVDPGAEMPDDFVSFERFAPLFRDSRGPLRELALEYAKYEFSRWEPPIEGLVQMCESPYPEVRDFVANALTCDEAPEHRRYRVDPAVLTADAVYSFCESKNRATRDLGMKLIDLHPRLQLPDELFRLTESPDRSVRAFVIRTFWSLYRDRGITSPWKPKPPPEELTGKKTKKSVSVEEQVGPGAPDRPEELPASSASLLQLLRRILFELPPGRPERQTAGESIDRLKPIPARQAKLNLIETLRDLAVSDSDFAAVVLPLLREFRMSRGKSESAACLVAIIRLEEKYPNLATAQNDSASEPQATVEEGADS